MLTLVLVSLTTRQQQRCYRNPRHHAPSSSPSSPCVQQHDSSLTLVLAHPTTRQLPHPHPHPHPRPRTSGNTMTMTTTTTLLPSCNNVVVVVTLVLALTLVLAHPRPHPHPRPCASDNTTATPGNTATMTTTTLPLCNNIIVVTAFVLVCPRSHPRPCAPDNTTMAATTTLLPPARQCHPHHPRRHHPCHPRPHVPDNTIPHGYTRCRWVRVWIWVSRGHTRQKTRTHLPGTGFHQVRVQVQLPIPRGIPVLFPNNCL